MQLKLGLTIIKLPKHDMFPFPKYYVPPKVINKLSINKPAVSCIWMPQHCGPNIPMKCITRHTFANCWRDVIIIWMCFVKRASLPDDWLSGAKYMMKSLWQHDSWMCIGTTGWGADSFVSISEPLLSLAIRGKGPLLPISFIPFPLVFTLVSLSPVM